MHGHLVIWSQGGELCWIMVDFLNIRYRNNSREKYTEIYPTFKVDDEVKDLMIRGRDFYAVWDEKNNHWSTRETMALRIMDRAMDEFVEQNKDKLLYPDIRIQRLRDSGSAAIDRWHKYVQKQMRDNYIPLDSKIVFADQKTKREDYVTKKLPYTLADGDNIPAYTELMTTLYLPEELEKLEWAVGSIIAGDSVHIQKMIVIYGEPGKGKGTYLDLIKMLFKGYWVSFDAKSVVSGKSFALEAFKSNPLVAIQGDGDLSHIKDLTKINSLISHEDMIIEEKFKAPYNQKFQTFIFMATNEPVAIVGSKSGMARRLIDVNPSGKLVEPKRYRTLIKQLPFELGGIAQHCLDIYKKLGEDHYYGYVARDMREQTDDFYNFIIDELYPVELQMGKVDGMELSALWRCYKTYCDDKNVKFPYTYRKFKSEIKGYFRKMDDRHFVDGKRVRNYYYDFDKAAIGIEDVSQIVKESNDQNENDNFWLKFNGDVHKSQFDILFADCPAQLSVTDEKTGNERPERKWVNCKTKLKDIDTMQLHYAKPPAYVIFIDFDEVDPETGQKSLEKNIELVKNEWDGPPTYAETSKSGNGIHLVYIYNGDPSQLSPRIGEKIEVKTMVGNSSMRRKLVKCNDIPIATISGGLPLKEAKTVAVEKNVVKDERHLRNLIIANLNKKIHPNTKPSVDFIFKILEEAYASGMKYDISDMKSAIMAFCANSTNNAEYCLDIFDQMKFKSEDDFEMSMAQSKKGTGENIVFFDIEVFPNLLLIVWKYRGKPNCVRMINPTPGEVEQLIKMDLVGFNNRSYDNHILYGRLMGYNNEEIFNLSQSIINKDTAHRASFGEAWNLSYADVYDFCSEKMSLKKWEIKLGIFHKENEYPWDQPLDKSHWEEVAQYCENDVKATEAVFENRIQDFKAREILADLSGLSVNHTTRQHVTKIIFGNEKHPKLNYVDLSETFPGYEFCKTGIDKERYSLPPTKRHQSIYMGEDPSEGGYVYSEPGMYTHVALLDVESLHPHTIIALNAFGDYTKRFQDILEARLAIKHHNYEIAKGLFDGKLTKYLDTDENADKLQKALKIVINSVYGLTRASFDNEFKDPRNVDNIVAKRGALFMITLKHEVQKRGFTVAHIKTDSIKIPNATPEIIKFCMNFAKKYGYTFDHEATFEKFCLVNDAVYICKVEEGKEHGAGPGEWSATGAQFQQPYVFKTLFSHEPLIFDDFCEIKNTPKSVMYLDMNEGLPEDEHKYVFVGKVGRFTPIVEGGGGGYLVKDQNEKKVAVTGTKKKDGGLYRWLESSDVEALDKKEFIDESYYQQLADNAVNDISKFGNFEEFAK